MAAHHRSSWMHSRLATVLAVSLLVAAGCTGDRDPAAGPFQSPDPVEPSEPAPEPEPEPEPANPPRPPTPTGFRALLPAAVLPLPGAAPAWTLGGTARGEGGALASLCQRTGLASLGATRTMTRQYVSGDLTATHQVARFGDDVSAGRTYEVLQTWLAQCAEQLRQRDLEPGNVPTAYTEVPRVGDRAGWSWLSHGSAPGGPDASDSEVQALVHDDRTLSWVIYRQIGQVDDYPEGQTPPELALPLMADRLT